MDNQSMNFEDYLPPVDWEKARQTETVTVHNEPLHLGIMPVSVEVMEDLFHLPPGYKIVHADYDRWNRKFDFTLVSDELPEVQEYQTLPRLSLLVTVNYHEHTPIAYRKITTEVKLS